jgi:hypothetical protein
MAQDADQLVRFFADVSVELHGVYRTSLEAGRFYRGHVETPTSKCGLIVPLAAEAEFIFDGQKRHRLAPGNLLIGGAGRRLEIAVVTSGFQWRGICGSGLLQLIFAGGKQRATDGRQQRIPADDQSRERRRGNRQKAGADRGCALGLFGFPPAV